MGRFSAVINEIWYFGPFWGHESSVDIKGDFLAVITMTSALAVVYKRNATIGKWIEYGYLVGDEGWCDMIDPEEPERRCTVRIDGNIVFTSRRNLTGKGVVFAHAILPSPSPTPTPSDGDKVSFSVNLAVLIFVFISLFT